MAQEAYGFNEPAMREVLRRLDEVDKTYDMIRRRLATFAVRRHEAVYMPGSQQVKLVRYSWLPAAYGGSSTTGIIVPAARTIYPKRWENSYDLNSSGDFEATTDTGYVANLGSLPLFNGWAIATLLPQPHPVFGSIWGITSQYAPSQYGAGFYNWLTEEQTDEWKFSDGQADLIRCATGNAAGEGDPRLWHLNWYGDVMLTHSGWWEVTFGYRGYVSATDHPYYDATDSGGDTYRLPAGFTVHFGVHRNFQAGTSVIGTNPDETHEMRNWHSGPHPLSVPRRLEFEKTTLVQSDTTAWHGQHHTRLSPYIKVTLDSGAASAGTPKFVLEKAWLSVKPAHRFNSASVQGFGTGANQYPGGWNDGLGTFVWYGSGSEPDQLDKDGAVVP